jgi:hypothetical protein
LRSSRFFNPAPPALPHDRFSRPPASAVKHLAAPFDPFKGFRT